MLKLHYQNGLGDTQKPFTNYDTYSPTLRPEIGRTILAHCTYQPRHFCQLDITTAFLNSHIDNELYLHSYQSQLLRLVNYAYYTRNNSISYGTKTKSERIICYSDIDNR
ncbi:hypothetical protein CANARDRAFT_27377 [[Candida] arabinofermentans NRRL YB-2248]|uniref:Reverse transcriptase Ty1/copia-type domain-containing protein n=1 Tax=[Candida] arabinofermentans NRRL YB-2248 TaxID=983967 RepID=A0A1E4T5L0_9ASCO|nr:hypothetical protein CANARDRAFT_27377 [[Candida] arabinofermentans NRRL YB-2248]